MRWRGRRQSTNVIDLTSVGSINVQWSLDGSINNNGLTIDTDGLTYGQVNGSVLNVYLIPPDTKPKNLNIDDWYPQITSNQVNSLRTAIGLFLTINKGSLQIGPPLRDADYQLVELVYNILGR